MPARYIRVFEPTPRYLISVPCLAQLAKRAALALLGFGSTAHAQWVLLLIKQHARLARLDTCLSQGHVGVMTEREPMLAAGEAIAQRPRGTIPSLLAQVEPVAVAE